MASRFDPVKPWEHELNVPKMKRNWRRESNREGMQTRNRESCKVPRFRITFMCLNNDTRKWPVFLIVYSVPSLSFFTFLKPAAYHNTTANFLAKKGLHNLTSVLSLWQVFLFYFCILSPKEFSGRRKIASYFWRTERWAWNSKRVGGGERIRSSKCENGWSRIFKTLFEWHHLPGI